jgi:hypothetical protein
VWTFAECQGERAEYTEALEFGTIVLAELVEGFGANNSASFGRRIGKWESVGFVLNTDNGLGRRGCTDHGWRSILAGVKTAQQLDRIAGILLSNSAAEDADLGIGKSKIASQYHKVE